MEKGGYSLGGVASRSAARSGGIGLTEKWFSAGGGAFWVGGGLEKIGEGRNL